MSRPIERQLVTTSGTIVTHSKAGGMSLHVRAFDARQAALTLAQDSTLDMSDTSTLVDVIGAAAEKHQLDNLSPIEKRVVLDGLLVAGERAVKAGDWTTAHKALRWLLFLGYLLHWLDTKDAVHTKERIGALKTQLDLGRDVAQKGELSRLNPDISSYMNLVAHVQLPAATREMASVFEGRFKAIDDRVASHDHAAGSTLKTSDFEASSGTRLVDSQSKHLVSYREAVGYVLYSFDNRAVYSDGQRFFFEAKPGEGLVELTETQARAVTFQPVPASRVSARFPLREDPEARPNMPFNWRGYGDAKLDVSWWGQCHASSMIGALGLSAAGWDVSVYDEQTKKGGDVSRDTISAMVVYLGDGAFYSIGRADGAGTINRSQTYDSDPPVVFHDFVSRHIAEGLPFVLEKYALDQVWNYPAQRASITPEGALLTTAAGAEQKYVMQVETTDGAKTTYYYSLTRDAAGNVVSSAWDMPRNIAANGKTEAVPDLMVGYLGMSPEDWALDASSPHAKDNGLDRASADLITDLYFASRTTPLAGDKRVYMVRRKDGSLEQLTKAEYERLPKP